MWFRRLILLVIVILFNDCECISNAIFNEQIRDYSLNNDNLTNAQTLQKDGSGLARYANFAPLQNTVRFKDVPDNVLSGSSHGRGLLNHDNGYGLYEYEDPHHGHGYEHGYDHDHIPHYYNHHEFHDDHHVAHHGYGHHHKHYDHHALAAKTILWPIAGIALLGAAAAFVTNPVLLQLGVVSGRKKRHIENLDMVKDSIKKWTPNPIKINQTFHNIPEFMMKRRIIKSNKNDNAIQVKGTKRLDELKHKSDNRIMKVLSKRYTDEDESNMVPVPLKYKESLKNVNIDNDYNDLNYRP